MELESAPAQTETKSADARTELQIKLQEFLEGMDFYHVSHSLEALDRVAFGRAPVLRVSLRDGMDIFRFDGDEVHLCFGNAVTSMPWRDLPRGGYLQVRFDATTKHLESEIADLKESMRVQRRGLAALKGQLERHKARGIGTPKG